MTTPHERTVALHRTWQFLRELSDPQLTPRIPLRVRQRALSLLRHFPDSASLSHAADAFPDVFSFHDDWTK
jgi:hypothetical protein